MSLVRRSYFSPTVNSNWNIWHEFDDMMRTFSRNYDAETSTPKKMFSPQAEFFKNEKGYLLSFDVPGIKEDEIKIDFNDSVLRIYGERKSEHKEQKEGAFHTEKLYGYFERSFRLPETIDEEKIEAHYNNGVLQVFLPKTPAKESKKIEIKKGATTKFNSVSETTPEAH